MDLLEQTRLLDRLSYCSGNVEGIITALKAMKKKDIDKNKLIAILETISFNLKRSIEMVRQDPGDGEEGYNG